MKCPVCGKRFEVLWPQLWRYKRGTKYLCSYGCMREIDEGGRDMERKLTDEMKAEAVRIALEGGEYCKYLRECGSLNPSAHWTLIKRKIMKEDPETYEKLAKLTGRKPKAEDMPAPKGGGEWLKAEPEEKKTERSAFNAIVNPLPVRAVGSRVREDCSYTVTPEGEMYLGNGGMWFQLPAEKWREFSKEILTALEQLGVEK